MRTSSMAIVLIVFGVLLAGVLVLRASGEGAKSSASESDAKPRSGMDASRSDYSKSGYDLKSLDADTKARLAERLTQQERQVLLEKGTEHAFTGELLGNKKDGVYACRLCGLPLFASDAKFNSGTGWPSFFKPLDSRHVEYEGDTSHGMDRTEITCARCGGHLGHVFEDGPRPTGFRYCVNSASLRFHEEGTPLPEGSRPVETKTAYFAGGCFWGIEDRFQQVVGVLDAVSGYMGGSTPHPTYKDTTTGKTGHAETVRVDYDPRRVSYGKLLEWFFKFHDPTQLNRQGPDTGSQYRSAIFAADEEQLRQTREYLRTLQDTPRFRDRKIVTQVERAGPFYEAEEYHQDYHAKHGGSCALPEE